VLPDQGRKVAAVASLAQTSQDRASALKHGTCGNSAVPPVEGPYRLSKAQGDACHAPEWDDSEMARFTTRRDRLLRWGYSTDGANDLAERLTLRDREGDGRHMCTECRHGRASRCPDGAPQPGDVLHRCAGFQE
jgi:hypothetical protein